MTCKSICASPFIVILTLSSSVSAQVIFRGTRSAGYGFVAFNTLEAAQKAVDLLNKKELDGRTLIVEVAKPAEEKQKEKKEKRASKKRSSKKSKSGAATDASGEGEATEPEKSAEPAVEGAAKSKKKRNAVSLFYPLSDPYTDFFPSASQRRPSPPKERLPLLMAQ